MSEIVTGGVEVAHQRVDERPIVICAPVIRLEANGLGEILDRLLPFSEAVLRGASLVPGHDGRWVDVQGRGVVVNGDDEIAFVGVDVAPSKIGLYVMRIQFEDERLELASEIIASVDGPREAGWEAAWLGELDRRVDAAKSRGESGADWTDVRSRLLKRLGRK